MILTTVGFWTILKRALLLRCPRCGRGKIFKRWFASYERCQVCNFMFEREEGFYTGAIAINLVVSELIVTAVVIPVAVWAALTPGVPAIPIFIALSPLPVILPFIFFRLTKSLWIGLAFWLDPPHRNDSGSLR
ncbi:MAG TPA: DUF983 domain-containing protein [Ktedonobacteraceae bacterium]|nr:DUF983 domain-containing protein [Ktedonobacteraceae bacterium]